MSGKMAVSWSIKDEANDVVKRTGEEEDEEEEKRILLEETGGDVDEGSSSNIDDLFPHTTADMFRFHALSLSLCTAALKPTLFLLFSCSAPFRSQSPNPTDLPIRIGPDPRTYFSIFLLAFADFWCLGISSVLPALLSSHGFCLPRERSTGQRN